MEISVFYDKNRTQRRDESEGNIEEGMVIPKISLILQKERERAQKDDEGTVGQCEVLVVQRFVYKGEKL